jgi:hypothetical protein
VTKNEPTSIYVKIVVRECMGKKKTKVKWLIKCLKIKQNKDQEKNDYSILQYKNQTKELNMKLWAR